jgi:putative sigma-54 modulation protein
LLNSMRLELTGRHVTITPASKKAVERRLAPIARMLNDSIVSVQVVVTKEKFRHHVDITLHARGDHFFHGEAAGRDLGTALASAVDKIERQAQRLKSKWSERKRQGISPAKAASAAPRPEQAAAKIARAVGAPEMASDASPMPSPLAPRIIRARRYMVKPMAVEEAALRVGPREHNFIVFWNAETDAFSVLFRRPDGNLGLIEPEA